MFLDRQTSYEQARAILAFGDWVTMRWRRLTRVAPSVKTVFLDTETTGLSPTKHEIIEIGMVIEHPSGAVESWCTKIAPSRIETANPKALEINGFTPEAWEEAPALSEVLPIVTEHLSGAVVVGHNVAFDLRFIRQVLDDVHLSEHDTQVLAREHLTPLGLRSVSLDNCRRWFGWSLDGAHTALVDAEDCRKLFHMLRDPNPIRKRLWRYLGLRRMR